MLVSVFTPSHNPEWLHDCWTCLKEQTHQNFEWIVVANGDKADVVATTVEHISQGDGRVRVLRMASDKIGALKRFACDSALGDLLLEFDHDDLLTDNCLEKVVEAANQAPNPRVCFVWSDNVTCDHDGKSNCYGAHWGWRQYHWTYKGKEYQVNEHHPLDARAMCEILYTPDHVRVWSKEAYRMVGGHNKEMSVADDHELMVRTYLKGVPFMHVKEPLYFHRQDGHTTCQERVEEIQAVSKITRNKYLHDLVKEWCRLEKLPMYDLGGAHSCPKGYMPVDKYFNPHNAYPRGKIECDVFALREYLQPNSVGCFRAFDFLEHIPASRVPELMNMIYELLVPGGWLLTQTPAVCDDHGRAGRGAYQDPTHISFWSSNNTWYLTNHEFMKYVPEIRCRFQSVVLANYYPSEWHYAHLIPYLRWDACALKDGNAYHPGVKEC